MQPKERSIGLTDGRTQEVEHDIWVFHPTNLGDHKGGPKCHRASTEIIRSCAVQLPK